MDATYIGYSILGTRQALTEYVSRCKADIADNSIIKIIIINVMQSMYRNISIARTQHCTTQDLLSCYNDGAFGARSASLKPTALMQY